MTTEDSNTPNPSLSDLTAYRTMSDNERRRRLAGTFPNWPNLETWIMVCDIQEELAALLAGNDPTGGTPK